MTRWNIILALGLYLQTVYSTNVFEPTTGFVFDHQGLQLSWNASYFTGTTLQCNIFTVSDNTLAFTTTFSIAPSTDSHLLGSVNPGSLSVRERSYIQLVDNLLTQDFSVEFEVKHYMIPTEDTATLGQVDLPAGGIFYDLPPASTHDFDVSFDGVFLQTSASFVVLNSNNVHRVSQFLPTPQVEPGLHTIQLMVPGINISNATFTITVQDTDFPSTDPCAWAQCETCGMAVPSTCSAVPFGFCNASMTQNATSTCSALCTWPWRVPAGTSCLDTTPLDSATAQGQVCTTQGTCIPACPESFEECLVFCGTQDNTTVSWSDSSTMPDQQLVGTQCQCLSNASDGAGNGGDGGNTIQPQCACPLGESTCPASLQCIPVDPVQVNCSVVAEQCPQVEDIEEASVCSAAGCISVYSFVEWGWIVPSCLLIFMHF